MTILIIVLIIACVYFYRKSKKEQRKPASVGKITYSVSGSTDKYKPVPPSMNDEKGYTALKLKGKDLGYFNYSDSPDKSHRILWRRNGTPENDNELYSSRCGNLIILRNGNVVYSSYINPPDGIISNREKSAVISNNGIFSVTTSINVHVPENSIRLGNTGQGVTSSIDTHSYTDKLYLSKNGVYLVVEACGSQYDSFRDTLLIVDMQEKEIIGKIPRKYYHSTDIEVFEEDKFVYFWYGKDSLVFDFEGNNINRKHKFRILLEAVERKELNDFKTAYTLFGEDKNDECARNLIRTLSNIDPLDVELSNTEISMAYRLLAEYYNVQEPEKALMFYESSLKYNPRAGVKRKISEIQKQIKSIE